MTPESTLKDAIQTALRAEGAWVYKVHGGPYSQQGIPDLLVCYQGKFLGLEVKVTGKKASPRQQWVMGRISEAGGTVATVWSVTDALAALLQADTEVPR